MSFEEKAAWLYLALVVATFGAYVGVVLSRARGGELVDVAYVAPMLWSIGASILASIVGQIVLAAVRPEGAGVKDVRDRDIDRHGERIGGGVLGVAMIGAFALALAGAEHFWIANAIYAAFVLSAVVGTTVKLVDYRRGLA